MGWEDEFTYLQVGCSLPGLYMSLYHVVYLVGTWQSVTGAGKKMQVFVGTIGATMLYVKGRARIRWIRWSGFHDLKTRWLTLCFSKRTCFAWMNDSLVYSKITYIFLENQSVFLILLKKVRHEDLICMYIYSTYRHDLTKLFNRCRLLAPDPLQVWALVVMKRWREAAPGHQNWLNL